MTTTDILVLFLDLQLVETLLLVGMLWAFYAKLSRRELYRWWIWSWGFFALYLFAGRLSVSMGPEWGLEKTSLVLLATLAGFMQAVTLGLGAYSLPGNRRVPPKVWTALLGAAAVVGLVIVGLSLTLREDAVVSFAYRTFPRQLFLAAAFFYCALILWKTPQWTAARSVVGGACGLYGLEQLYHALGSASTMVDATTVPLLSWFSMPQLEPHIFLLDMVWEAGIAVGVVLLLTDEYAASERALRLSESRYRALIESSQGLICTHDMDGYFLSVNRAAAHLLGYEPEEIIGHHASEFLAPWSLERVEEYFGYLVRDGSDSGLLRPKTKDGREMVWVYQSVTFEEPGQRPIVLGHAQDITDRIRAEEALRVSEARQRALLGAIPDMMFVIRRDGTLVDFKSSRDFEPLRPPEDFLGTTVADTLPEGPARLAMESIRKALDTGELVTYEYDLASPGGPDQFEARVVPAGEDQVIAIVRDITARKRAEAALQRSEAALAEAQRIAHVGSWDWDLVYGRLACSREMFRLYGLPYREAGDMDEFLGRVHPEDRDRVRAAMTQCLETGAPCNAEYRVMLPDRSERLLHAQSEVVVDGAGKPIRMIGTVMDVTRHREVERMKDEFVSVVSHELRTPLTSIRGSLGLLATGRLGDLSPKGRRMLDVAVSNTDRLVRLLNDILDLERMKTGKVEILPTEWAVGDVMQEACEIMQPNADRAGVALEVEVLDTILEADRDRIVQVLTNLLSNAIKFSPVGGTIRMRAENQDDEVIFHVHDRGRGIPAEKADIIFGMFQQVDRSDAREMGGAGMGLAICRSIVEQHGGRIWFESQPGKGSTFSFSIPVVPQLHTA